MGIPTRGAVFLGPEAGVRVEPLVLDPPGLGEVLVRMVASGVCGSDRHVVDGEWRRPSDVVLGHEGAGVVEALGEEVPERTEGVAAGAGPGVRVGDLVVLAWTAPCGRCLGCARGEAWLCSSPRGAGHRLDPDLVRLRRPDGSPVGVYSGIGTFAERQVVAAEAAVPIEPATPPALAALIGCAVTTGVGAVLDTARVRAGESVVVIGLGGVGLAAVMAASLAGASPVVAVDHVESKLELALAAGATHALDASDAGLVPAVRSLARAGPDHAFECIGRTDTAGVALQVVRPGGTVTLVGMTPQGERLGVDVYRFVEDGLTLRGSNYGSAVPALAFPRIARLYRDGRLPLDLLVSERIGLDDLDAALEAMRRGEGARRVVVFEETRPEA